MNINRERKKINKVRKKINKSRIINQDIIKVSVFFCILAAALMVYLCVFMTFQASSVINNTYNKRSESMKKTVMRGSIYAQNGEVLAYSEINGGTENRIYPMGRVFAHVVGFEENGALGLESSYNYYMLTTHTNMFEKIANEFNSVKNPGDSIYTTLNVELQNYIYNALGNVKGAVIAINPSDGRIYAMVSKPDFDPNTVSENWDMLLADTENSPFVNRAAQGRYTPGSTFKIFTLNEFMHENPEYESFSFECSSSINVQEGVDIHCYDYTAHGSENLKDAFAYSCNCAFSQIGLGLNIADFNSRNEGLLFNKKLPVDLAYTEASFDLKAGDSDFEIMQTAFGQGRTVTNPLHLSLVMSAIANNGILMNPHLVTKAVNDRGEIVKKFNDSAYETLFSSAEAEKIKEYLRAVVEYGTGNVLNNESYTAYGKTGTAQTSSIKSENKDNSWFTGYAEKDGQKLVICAIIEDTDAAGLKAVDLTKQIFDFYFGS